MIGEPVGRDTANAVALAAAVIAADDPDAVIAFVTSDHVIEPIDGFRSSMTAGFDVVDRMPNAFVTFGIVPTSAHTGLGYIEIGEPLGTTGVLASARAVDSFTEKPDAATAAEYVRSGRFWWNSGMFVWRADAVLAALAVTLPGRASRRSPRSPRTGTLPTAPNGSTAVYGGLQKISVDYAVLEPTARGENDATVVVVPLTVDWLDVGSWPTLAQILTADVSGNAVDGATVLVDSQGNIIVSDDPSHLVATVGVSDMIVVHTRDVTMVCPKSEAQRVKELVARVEADHGSRFS